MVVSLLLHQLVNKNESHFVISKIQNYGHS